MGVIFPRQCSGNRCLPGGRSGSPHRGRRGGAGRANSKKDLVTGRIRVSVPFRPVPPGRCQPGRLQTLNRPSRSRRKRTGQLPVTRYESARWSGADPLDRPWLWDVHRTLPRSSLHQAELVVRRNRIMDDRTDRVRYRTEDAGSGPWQDGGPNASSFRTIARRGQRRGWQAQTGRSARRLRDTSIGRAPF